LLQPLAWPDTLQAAHVRVAGPSGWAGHPLLQHRHHPNELEVGHGQPKDLGPLVFLEAVHKEKAWSPQDPSTRLEAHHLLDASRHTGVDAEACAGADPGNFRPAEAANRLDHNLRASLPQVVVPATLREVWLLAARRGGLDQHLLARASPWGAVDQLALSQSPRLLVCRYRDRAACCDFGCPLSYGGALFPHRHQHGDWICDAGVFALALEVPPPFQATW